MAEKARELMVGLQSQPVTVSVAGGGMIAMPALSRAYNPAAKRRLYSLKRAEAELAKHLGPARIVAIERVNALVAEDAKPQVIADARYEAMFLCHARGPRFQLAVLAALGYGKIEPVIMPDHDALERVREIAMAITAALGQQPRIEIERAVRHLHRPVFPDDVAAEHLRLAEQFLDNSAADNLADPRFARAQALVDQAGEQAAIISGSRAADIAAAMARTKADIAERIRDGELDIIDIL